MCNSLIAHFRTDFFAKKLEEKNLGRIVRRIVKCSYIGIREPVLFYISCNVKRNDQQMSNRATKNRYSSEISRLGTPTSISRTLRITVKQLESGHNIIVNTYCNSPGTWSCASSKRIASNCSVFQPIEWIRTYGATRRDLNNEHSILLMTGTLASSFGLICS